MPLPPPPKRRSQDEEGDGDDFGGPEREDPPTVSSPTHVEGLMEEDVGGSPVAALDYDVGEGHDCSSISARSKERCRRSMGTLEGDLEEEKEEEETWSQHEHWRVPGFLKGRREGGGVSGEDIEDLPPLAIEVGRLLCIGCCLQPRDQSQ